jgi:single-strand DNA-binding protein
MYQKLIIIGNCGSDAELRYLPDGTPVCTFSLADSRVVKKGVDETTWFRVTRFGKQAEVLAQYLLKGASVCVEGRLKPDDKGNPRVYQRKDGTWGSSFDVTADNIQFVGNKKSEQLTDEEVPF